MRLSPVPLFVIILTRPWLSSTDVLPLTAYQNHLRGGVKKVWGRRADKQNIVELNKLFHMGRGELMSHVSPIWGFGESKTTRYSVGIS